MKQHSKIKSKLLPKNWESQNGKYGIPGCNFILVRFYPNIFTAVYCLLLAMHIGIKDGTFHEIHPTRVSLADLNPILEKKNNNDASMKVIRLGKRTPMSLRQYLHDLRSRG